MANNKQVYCGLCNDNGEEIHTYIPFEKARLGKKIVLKDKHTDEEKDWKIFGVLNKVFIGE